MQELQKGLKDFLSKNGEITNKFYLRNEIIKVQNTIDTNIYIVNSGTVRIFQYYDDKEITIRFGYKGDFISALDSFFTDENSALCFQALRKTELSIIRKEKFIEFLNSDFEWQTLWTRNLEVLIIQQMERELDLLLDSPIDRFKRVLERSPKLFQEVPSKYIASYLRMTPETLSRLRKG